MEQTTLWEFTTDLYTHDSIGMYYCGKRIKTKNHVYGPEIRDHHLFVFVDEGEADMYENGRIVRPLKKHDLLVMCPGEKIYYRAKTPWSIQWVGLYGKTVDDFVKKLEISGQAPIMEIKAHFEMQELLERLYVAAQDKTVSATLTQTGLIYAFFSILFREKGVMQSADYVSAAKKIIEHNLNHPLSVESVAKSLHVHPSYFTRLFANQTGITPKQYILEKKMDRAKTLLIKTAATIEEIAISVGFADPLYFSRLFHKKEGVSPRAYRRREV